MISIAYIFKPRARQVDMVRLVVDDLRARGLEDMNISRFYEYAVEKAIADYRNDPKEFFRNAENYFRRRLG